MSDISNSIRLNDYMSSTLHTINNTMEQTIAIMQRLDTKLHTLGTGGNLGNMGNGLSAVMSRVAMLEGMVASIGTGAGPGAAMFNQLNAQLTAAQAKIQQLEARLNSLGNNNGLPNAGNQANQTANNIDKANNKAGKLLDSLKQLASFTVITILIKTSFDTFANYEQEMARVKAITNATDDEFKQLEATSRELGRNTTFSATEAAQGMKYLGMAGWETNQIVGAMPGMLNLAAAGSLDLARTADIVSDTMTGFGLSAGQAMHVADVFATTVTSTNTNIEMMGEAMKYVSPISKQFGADIEQTAGMIGLMANAGIKASQAGTSLRAGMLRMADPRARAEMQLEKLGLSFVDASGNMKDMQLIIHEVSDAFATLNESSRLAAAQRIFGVEAASGWLAMLDQGPEALDAMVEQLRNSDGASQAMADIMNDTLLGNLKLMQSYAQDAMIEIGTAMRDGLKEQDIGSAIIDTFKAAVDFIEGLVMSIIPFIVQIGVAFQTLEPIFLMIFTMIGEAASLIGTALSMIGEMFNTVLEPVLPLLAALVAGLISYKAAVMGIAAAKGIAAAAVFVWTAALTAAKTIQDIYIVTTHAATLAQWRLNMALIANPIGLVVMLIGILIGVLIYFMITNEEVRIKVMTVWYSLLNGFDQIGLGIQNIFYGLLNTIDKFVLGALEKIEDLINGALGFTNQLPDPIKKMFGLDGGLKPVDLTSTVRVNNRIKQQERFDKMYEAQKAVLERANERQDALDKMKNGPEEQKSLDDILGPLINTPEIPGGTTDIGNVDRVGKVGKIDDDVNIADEDMKMLMELAVQNRVNQINLTVQTAAPNITQHMAVNNELDIQAVANEFATSVYDASQVTVDQDY